MAASISAVAAIWVNPPRATQARNSPVMRGSASPVNCTTSSSDIAANGKPKTKRTRVAPTVPTVVVRPFCIALRAVWEAAATSVSTIHNHQAGSGDAAPTAAPMAGVIGSPSW